MSTKVYMRLLIQSEHLVQFVINKPTPSEEGFYRQTVSIEAFRSRQHKRLQAKQYWFYHEFQDEHDIGLSADRRLATLLGEAEYGVKLLPHVECSSVWDFYEKVGYNYKTKKFASADVGAIFCINKLERQHP